MRRKILNSILAAVCLNLWAGLSYAKDEEKTVCFESREGRSEVAQREIRPGLPNVKCSPRTSGVLWWGDPFDGTIPMGEMPVEADYSHAEAVVKPREEQIDKNKLLSICATACHDGNYVPVPTSMEPRPLKMHQDIVPDSMDLQHGRGAMWCLNCHSAENRTRLIDHFGNEISFNQPQKLCGKCHGQVYRDWRDGIHGKRIGMWKTSGKKRWWTCTECHNPHDVQQGMRNSGFAQLQPEPAPALPKGMANTDHEKHAEHGDPGWWQGVLDSFFGSNDH
ncbi:MAG: hypothetical protein GY820_07775 [Gammaproteobacteria bacterium]|nr:hypothetical protein [Gammaproteobacteria bacterium]